MPRPPASRTSPARSEPRSASENTTQAARRQEILEVAAQLFATRGYKATSIRQIAEELGMMAGSLYYHIRSKETLFVEIHNRALDAAASRIFSALAPHTSPWARLEAACRELLDIQLSPSSLTLPLMNTIRSVPPEVRNALIKKRDEFEAIFRNIVEDLPLPPTIDRDVYRIILLRVLNTANDWYHPGRLSREEIARQIFDIFRHTRSETDATSPSGKSSDDAPGASRSRGRPASPRKSRTTVVN
ncbi:TetR/AcrR family transcriptional regulator [Acidomonas methanolica]|uniref:TetR/AcrR family transcriptional regulator n=1 Tax=Acidomonas methanolica TaxID=437 RepID=UPI00211A8987|nr:TetR/AcrR family transcriptional regulator [Acidomonas methanolica]MCQ9154231.1 TetR family transcriptional regulator [Acidomonas methanolica]